MKLGVLFSGGKDSTYATWLAKKYRHEISCLISIKSTNEESFMFHTPNVNLCEKQANVMGLPIIVQGTKGEKEAELKDLESAIKKAIKKYKIEGVITGAVESVYQASRVQKICDKMRIECFNPLWQKDQEELLRDLIKDKFKIIISSVAGEGLDRKLIGRVIDASFIKDILRLKGKYGINVAGEGGEYETFVLDCPMFKRELKIKNISIFGSKNSYRGEIELI